MKAANVEVEPYWPGLITTIGCGAAPAAPAVGGAAPAAEDKKNAKKKEEDPEESDDDMDFALFG